VKIKLARTQYRRGETIAIKAAASKSTRTLMARMDGAAPVALRWDPQQSINSGALMVPEQLLAGKYRLTVIAEDIAHNVGTQEVQIDVLP